MKVRYETRLEKIQREYNKLQSSAEKIQRERDLDKDIIKGIQRGMGELRAKYTQDVAGWQKEKLQMERKIKEVTVFNSRVIPTLVLRGSFNTRVYILLNM